MKILYEKEARRNPELIRHCWCSRAPFVILPDPCPVSAEWVQDRIEANRECLPEDAYFLLTSGSTGKPKIVVGSRARAESLASRIHQAQHLESVGSTIIVLPFSYSYAFVNQWLWSTVFNRRLVVSAGLAEPSALIDSLKASEEAMICLVGAMVPVLRKFIGSDTSFHGISTVNFAGGVFPQGQLPWLRAVFPEANFFHNYGCTEAMPRLTVRSADEFHDPLILGTPLEGIELKAAQSGELLFRSPYSACAVIEDSSYKRFEDSQWIGTGDLVETLPAGRFRLMGRTGEVFKRFGEKVSLTEISEAIRDACECEAWLYTETTTEGETGYVVVVESSALPASVLQKLLLMFRQKYRRAIWPNRIETTSTVLLSHNGKADLAGMKIANNQVVWRQRI